MQFKTRIIIRDYTKDENGYISISRFNLIKDKTIFFDYYIKDNYFFIKHKNELKKFKIEERTDYVFKFLKTKVKISSKEDFLKFIDENKEKTELFHKLIQSNFCKIFNIINN